MNTYNNGDAKWYFNAVSVTPGKYYVFSDEYKSTVDTHVVVEFHTAGNTLSYQEIGVPAASADWKKFQAGFNVPLGVTSLTVYHLINNVGVLTVDNFSLVQENNPGTFNKGMVSLTFDDGWQTNYDTAIPILNAAGFKSTQYIITNYIGDTADGYMTLEEIKTIYQQGHDIAAHTRNHLSLTDPTTDLQDEINGSRTDLLANFSPVNSIAYPFGRYNATVESVAQSSGFMGGRTVDLGFNDKSTNPYALNVQIVERGGVCGADNAPATTLDQVKNWIDTASATNTWLILVFHQTDNDNSNCYGDTPQTLQSIVNYLKTSNVDVVTVSEGLQKM
jgi:peptidoglycan/xylan/chitin deacetylase (PgdA/CDA1 family)